MKVATSRPRTAIVGGAAALAVVAGGVAAAAAITASNVTAQPTRVAGLSQAALARASLVRYLRDSRPVLIGSKGSVKPSTPDLRAGAAGTSGVGSYNWSGYADVGSPGAFTAASGDWWQPSTRCSSEQRLAAFWVGLDGYSSATVEQDGTLAYCFEGVAYYYSWWEMYPGALELVGSTVRPGDLITASVTRRGTSYTLALTDHGSPANSFSTVQSCGASTCQDSSAEWIAERPAFSIGIAPLSYFTGWGVVNASQTSDGHAGSISSGPSPTQITMVDATDTYALDSVSGLSPSGRSFLARWLNSY